MIHGSGFSVWGLGFSLGTPTCSFMFSGLRVLLLRL